MKTQSTYQIRFLIVLASLCLTIFAIDVVHAGPAQNETTVNIFRQMRTNQNESTLQLAHRLDTLINNNQLVVSYDSSKFNDPESCGTIGFLGTDIPTLYLNKNSSICSGDLASILIHEYEHLRILQEEVFERTLAAAAHGEKPNGLSDLDAKAVDYMQGLMHLKGFEEGGDFVLDGNKARQIMTHLQFRVYSESKAYLSTRKHLGKNIKEYWSDEQIVNTLHGMYVSNKLSLSLVRSLFEIAKNSANYDAYLNSASAYREPSYALSALEPE